MPAVSIPPDASGAGRRVRGLLSVRSAGASVGYQPSEPTLFNALLAAHPLRPKGLIPNLLDHQALVFDGPGHWGIRFFHGGRAINYRKSLPEESIGFRGWRFSVRIRVEGVAIQRWRGWRFSVDNFGCPQSARHELFREWPPADLNLVGVAIQRQWQIVSPKQQLAFSASAGVMVAAPNHPPPPPPERRDRRRVPAARPAETPS